MPRRLVLCPFTLPARGVSTRLRTRTRVRTRVARNARGEPRAVDDLDCLANVAGRLLVGELGRALEVLEPFDDLREPRLALAARQVEAAHVAVRLRDGHDGGEDRLHHRLARAAREDDRRALVQLVDVVALAQVVNLVGELRAEHALDEHHACRVQEFHLQVAQLDLGRLEEEIERAIEALHVLPPRRAGEAHGAQFGVLALVARPRERVPGGELVTRGRRERTRGARGQVRAHHGGETTRV